MSEQERIIVGEIRVRRNRGRQMLPNQYYVVETSTRTLVVLRDHFNQQQVGSPGWARQVTRPYWLWSGIYVLFYEEIYTVMGFSLVYRGDDSFVGVKLRNNSTWKEEEFIGAYVAQHGKVLCHRISRTI
jgi:hypothetical protein